MAPSSTLTRALALLLPTILLALIPAAAALNITYLQANVSLAPSPLPLPGAASHADEIVAAFANLGRTTVWNLVAAVKLQGDTYEPEGMVRLGDDRIVVSAGEYTVPTVSYGNSSVTVVVNGTDRSAGAGFAHLIVFNATDGSRIADATLTAVGAIEYHNGGIDYDGTSIYATIAQYRPNSTATLMRVDPATLEPTPLLHVADHEGGVVHDTLTGDLVMLNWGSRNASTWNPALHAATTATYPGFARPPRVRRNPSYWADYQDCKFVGHPAALGYRSTMACSGVTALYGTQIGGIALVDVESMVPVMEVPLTMKSALGTLITENPFDLTVVDGKLRVYFVPDQHNSTLYVYEAGVQSPFEFGGGMQ